MDFDFLVLSDIHECQTGKHNRDTQIIHTATLQHQWIQDAFATLDTALMPMTTHYPLPPPLLIVIYNANVLYNVKKELK